MNYQDEMNRIIASLDGEPKLLLHSCCAPCSSSVLENLTKHFKVTVLYYNPNIEPSTEFLHRKNEQIKLLKQLKIPYLEIDYANGDFKLAIRGHEKDAENGYRCQLCYRLRLEKTAWLAKDQGFDYFTTTLTVSPHKNSNLINEIGDDLGRIYKIKYLPADFKKNGGYQRSIELSKTYNLYRQRYCGCLYSKESEE